MSANEKTVLFNSTGDTSLASTSSETSAAEPKGVSRQCYISTNNDSAASERFRRLLELPLTPNSNLCSASCRGVRAHIILLTFGNSDTSCLLPIHLDFLFLILVSTALDSLVLNLIVSHLDLCWRGEVYLHEVQERLHRCCIHTSLHICFSWIFLTRDIWLRRRLIS